MSYVKYDPDHWGGYTVQKFARLLNRPGWIPEADVGIYTEHGDSGQCVFLTFDLSSMVNYETGYCTGATPHPARDFQPGFYEGRAELMRVILEDVFGLPSSGAGTGGGPGTEPRKTYRWALDQNSPNPAVSTTQIRFEIARACDVRIRIYNALGQTVRDVIDDRRGPGSYSVTWDGTNSTGRRVSSGVYFYRMTAGRFTATRKMLVVN
jgi:hypothetical protein